VGFEPTTPVLEPEKIFHASDRGATVVGFYYRFKSVIIELINGILEKLFSFLLLFSATNRDPSPVGPGSFIIDLSIPLKVFADPVSLVNFILMNLFFSYVFPFPFQNKICQDVLYFLLLFIYRIFYLSLVYSFLVCLIKSSDFPFYSVNYSELCFSDRYVF
jgi:hypothetical protein